MNKGVLESQGNNTLFIFRFGWKQKKYCSKHGISINAGIAVHIQHSEHSSVTLQLQQHISILSYGLERNVLLPTAKRTHQSHSIQVCTLLSKSYAMCM